MNGARFEPDAAGWRTTLPPSDLCAEAERLKSAIRIRDIIGQSLQLKRHGKLWAACCPFHGEKTPSFHVYPEHYHCFGCGAHGDVFDWLMQTLRVTFPEAVARLGGDAVVLQKTGRAPAAKPDEVWQPMVPVPDDAPAPPARLTACDRLYEYRDMDGRLLCFVRRFEATEKKGKLFLPVTYGRLNGKMDWFDKAPGSPRPLYGLDRLAEADPAATVLLCEGEKSADAAARLFPNYVAMSWFGGVRSADLADLAPLAGRSVTIWPDADKPGRDAAAGLAARLRGSLIVKTAGLPDKFDAADLEADEGEDRDAWLSARMPEIEAPELEAKPKSSPDLEPEDGIWNAGLDDYKIPPRGWLLGTTFCRRFLSALLADGGVGKTAVRIAQLISLALGRSLTGEHVFMRCRVLIVSLEDDRDELRRRVYAVMRHHGIKPAEVDRWLFLWAPKGLRLAEIEAGAPAAAKLLELLHKNIPRHRIDIVSLDPFVKSHGLEENSNTALDFVCTLLAKIAIEHDCAIDLPHHTRKGVGAPGDADRGRGGSSMKDAARLVYTLTPMSTEEGAQFGVAEAERRSLIRMDSGKVNIAPPSVDATWFRLIGVPLDNGGGIYPAGDTVQTVERWQPPDTWADAPSPVLNRILDDIDAGLPNGSRYSGEPSAKTRAAWKVVSHHIPDKPEQMAREIIKAWIKTGLLVSEPYDDPEQRKSLAGLNVVPSKRPT